MATTVAERTVLIPRESRIVTIFDVDENRTVHVDKEVRTVVIAEIKETNRTVRVD